MSIQICKALSFSDVLGPVSTLEDKWTSKTFPGTQRIAGKGGGAGKCKSSHLGGIERGSSFSSHLVVCYQDKLS